MDVLVNNAGAHVQGRVHDVPIEHYHRTLQTNFFAAVRLASAMISRAGYSPPMRIVNVLSTTAIAGRMGLSPYSSSKAALWAFSRSLKRVHGRKIQILEVLPATFESSLAEKAIKIGGAAGGQTDAMAARRLSSETVAARVHRAELNGDEMLYIPLEARAAVILEATMPFVFRRLFR